MPSESSDREVMTVTDVAVELLLTPGIVRRLARSGALPAIRVTPSDRRVTYRFARSDVEAYLRRLNGLEDADARRPGVEARG